MMFFIAYHKQSISIFCFRWRILGSEYVPGIEAIAKGESVIYKILFFLHCLLLDIAIHLTRLVNVYDLLGM
jgi:hypothetical protein